MRGQGEGGSARRAAIRPSRSNLAPPLPQTSSYLRCYLPQHRRRVVFWSVRTPKRYRFTKPAEQWTLLVTALETNAGSKARDGTLHSWSYPHRARIGRICRWKAMSPTNSVGAEGAAETQARLTGGTSGAARITIQDSCMPSVTSGWVRHGRRPRQFSHPGLPRRC